jgi:hypothetical protein
MPIYEVTGDFVVDDVKFGDTVSVLVESASPPDREEAERLLTPAAQQALRGARGDLYAIDFRAIKVVENPAFDLLCRPWGVRVAWELRDGGLDADELARRCSAASGQAGDDPVGGVHPALVVLQRLGELIRLGLIEGDGSAFGLSSRGRELVALLAPLEAWARGGDGP